MTVSGLERERAGQCRAPRSRNKVLTRRHCLAALAAFIAPARADAPSGRLTARPGTAPPLPPAPRGGEVTPLGLESRDAFLYAPASFSPRSALPLVVVLHGSGDDGRYMADALKTMADKHGVLLLAPSSRGHTWDVHHAPACDDTLFIDRALAKTFACTTVDAKRIALMGLSDGGAFTLSLGLANGDYFSDLQAFSASTFHVPATAGKPRLFVSHGRRDTIIPFATGQRIADTLSAAGYDVMFRPFDGGHEMPKDGLDAALNRFLS
jgi:phospholipase/carboxylesterase